MSIKRKVRMDKKKKKLTALVALTGGDELPAPAADTTLVEPSSKRSKTMVLSKLAVTVAAASGGDNGATIRQPQNHTSMPEDELQTLKRILRDRSEKSTRQRSIFRLRDMGYSAALDVKAKKRVPLFLSDIQHLVLFSQLGRDSPYLPMRWCTLDKQPKLQNTVVFLVEDVSWRDFEDHRNLLNYLDQMFASKVEFLAPHTYNGDLVKDLSMVPLTGQQMKKFTDEYGTLDQAVLKNPDLFDTLHHLFPIDAKRKNKRSDKSNGDASGGVVDIGSTEKVDIDKFPRTQLLLSAWQMVEENFPLPIKNLMDSHYAGYKLSKDEYEKVTSSSPMLSVDCEMCQTTTGELELTRISVVDEQLNVFYDTLVKPSNKIVDYLTRFSGITGRMMKNVTKTLSDVQEDLRRLLPPDVILVGQSLSNDLHAMKMMHPYVIDTSVVYNLSGERGRKTKLSKLCQEFLQEQIQQGNRGHCSIEDSMAAMKLVKLKLQRHVYFGDSVMGGAGEGGTTPIGGQHPEFGTLNYATSMLKQIATRRSKVVTVVSSEDVISKYTYYVNKRQRPPAVEDSSESTKVRFFSECSIRESVKRACACLSELNVGLLVIHADAKSEVNHKSDAASSTRKTFKQLNKCVRKLCEEGLQSYHNSLVIVIFGGTVSANGGAFITVNSAPLAPTATANP